MVAVLVADERPVFDVGEWLVANRVGIEGGESKWLGALAEFDSRAAWELEGQLSGANWLMWRCKMARSTAFDKLRIAHELARRPIVGEAFGCGQISYSAVRAITRLDDVSAEVDQALVDLAAQGTVLSLEQAIRHYRLHDEQDRPSDQSQRRFDRRGLRMHRGLNGMGSAEIVLGDTELAELAMAVDAFVERDATKASAVDESSPADSSTAEVIPFWVRKTDAFMDMVRTSLAHIGDEAAVGADRYMLHLVIDGAGRSEMIDGTPIDEGSMDRIACDSSVVSHFIGEGAEPLALGRRTRQWNRAQRRAIAVRDHHRCRFPGCDRTIGDIHHLRHWTKGGNTDVDNGLFVCSRHHTLIHQGFEARGNANSEVTFFRKDGTVLGITGCR